MTLALVIAALLLATTLLSHLVTVTIAIVRCRAPAEHLHASPSLPPVTLVRPICGLDNFDEATLASSFDLDYPEYEIIFCAASARDAAVTLAQGLIAAHPAAKARLLIGDERISINPKLNNCYKGWTAATHDWIVLADSNVMMPRDYLTRLMAAWRPDTGLVCSPPAGACPLGFWAEVECAILNAYQARMQYFADSAGLGFAQGKTMLWRRDILERGGGIRLLGAETAEDAASTKLVRAAGLRVRLVDAPFSQPLGRRRAREVWQRQARWAQLRRASFPHYFAPEILAGALWPLASGAWLALALGFPLLQTLLAIAAVFYGTEMALARAAGWPLSLAYPLYAATRDLMLPALWINGWLGSNFVWRGNPMSSAVPSELPRT